MFEDVIRPGVLAGWLQLVFETENRDEGEAHRWRLQLDAHTPWSKTHQKVALSDWAFGSPPDLTNLTLQQITLNKHVRILGKVIGWN
jgi:hypothetical protein